MAVIGLGCPKMLRGRRKTESSLVGLEKRNAPVFHGSAAILRRSLLSDSGAPNGPFTIFKTGSLSDLRNKNTSVYVHQYTDDPTVAWEMLKASRQVKNVRKMSIDTPLRLNYIRFVCIACLHGVRLDPNSVPPGDVLIVAGDFTNYGLPDEVKDFNSYMACLKQTFKVVIAGNHDCSFDENFLRNNGKSANGAQDIAVKTTVNSAMSSAKINSVKSLLTNVIYLQDSMVELYGLKIYGSPWQPKESNLAFNLPRGQHMLEKWNKIPTGIDVLITHTPPLGHGDLRTNGTRAGCVELLNSVVKRIRPKYHVFGHVHEGYGCTTDGYTKFINCCLMDEQMSAHNEPIIFDMAVSEEDKSIFLKNSIRSIRKLSKSKKS